MLTIIKIEGRKPDLASYDPGYFITDGYIVYSFTPSLGFIERRGIDRAKLDKHIQKMKDEGFTITIQEV